MSEVALYKIILDRTYEFFFGITLDYRETLVVIQKL